MKNSIQDLKSQLTAGEKISMESLRTIKGGGTIIVDPRRPEGTDLSGLLKI